MQSIDPVTASRLINRMPAPDSVKRLIENFATHLDHYKSSGYNETEVRREYLDPFWKALGWDIDNRQGYADAYKDVIHEDAIKIGGYTKAPDYCFRIGGTRKFFLEAKKPSIDVKDDLGPAYQLRRYAWSAKLPLSVLSDFEELAVYDCRAKPKTSDKASTARTVYCTFDDYESKWDEIAAIFSREAVLKGSFDKYVETSKKKRGTAEVDEAFLEEIERWRELFARNLALRNPQLSVRDLNFAVQKTIDRLIFLRICEDRGTEDYGRLREIGKGAGTYSRLLELFRRADERYNSGLFHFRDERGRPGAPDHLTPDLQLDDKVLKDVLKNLYYPDSPYEFSVLPADILGQVYEQFLGKTIRLTSGHQAKIDEKPEVRKAGGVYYTPSYIVDYIVESTLGRLLNGSDPDKPKPISVSQAEKLRILDPACGSGSFLIVAYQYLLDWHRDQYTLDPLTHEEDEGKIKRHAGGKSPKIYEAPGGEWRLTTTERKRILLNNIHGVDIDSQAVEVTKLSLLLKVLEGETQQQLQRDFIVERERILPDLGKNIRCGNSLIGPEFYGRPDLLELNPEARYRINAFDWEQAFPETFNQGGFDCVIGNPPYIRIQSLRDISPEQADYFIDHYETAAEGNFDIYVCFMEKALALLNHRGVQGYIIPNKFMSAAYGRPLRRLLARGKNLQRLVSFGAEQVFPTATTYTCIAVATKADNSIVQLQRAYDIAEWRADQYSPTISSDSNIFGADPWYLVSDTEADLLAKLRESRSTLSDICKSITQGLKTGSDATFVCEVLARQGDIVRCYSKALDSVIELETAATLQLAKGGDMARFSRPDASRLVIFPYTSNGKLLTPDELESQFPQAWSYLHSCRSILNRREKGRFSGEVFYQFSRAQCIGQSLLPKILTPDIAPAPRFSPDFSGEFAFLGGAAGGYGVIPHEGSHFRSLLCILNSRLFHWFIRLTSTMFRGGWNSYEKRYIGGFPLPSASTLQSYKSSLEPMGEQMLQFHEAKASEKNPETLRRIDEDIAITDRGIDRLVYEVYDLTGSEIYLVEAAAI